MQLLAATGLPAGALAAAAEFHARVLPQLPAQGDLLIRFDAADHTHRGWRLAAIQQLARDRAPGRVNAVAGGGDAAVASARAYLASAAGLTGQLLDLDDLAAGPVIG